ncbi:MAG TPA: hypothetical protein VNY53_10835 [Bradyrhizobium sp.]|nr:hypothetical protein [Bradyrhizobium sp.]
MITVTKDGKLVESSSRGIAADISGIAADINGAAEIIPGSDLAG